MIACLLLAAGQSKRMGERNKLLLPVSGTALVSRTALELLKFPFDQIIAITGYDAEKVESALQFRGIQLVRNENYQTGMHSSIRAGLKELRSGIDGFVVCLADQPDLRFSVIRKMVDGFYAANEKGIIFPVFDGKKGNPVLISSEFIPEILAQPDGDYGCSYLFKRHPNQIHGVDVDEQGVLIDIDTPEDYQKWETPNVF